MCVVVVVFVMFVFVAVGVFRVDVGGSDVLMLLFVILVVGFAVCVR